MARKTSKNIYSEFLLRIGDRVVMNMDEEARSWGRRDVADGTIGTVVGFKRIERHYGRINNFGHKPGKYSMNGVSVIAWDDGTTSHPGASDLYWRYDTTEKEQRLQDHVYNEAFKFETYLEPLPASIVIYEGDLIKLQSQRLIESWETDVLRVRAIDFDDINRKRDDGSPFPIYDVEHPTEKRGTMRLDETEVALYERGNVYKYYNGLNDQIKFESFEEEVRFHMSLGLYEQIRNEKTGNYHWPLEHVLPAAKDKIIDVIQAQNGFFGAGVSMIAYKFTDPDLSQRCNAKLIEGFSK